MSSNSTMLPTQRQALWQLLVLAAPLVAVSLSRLLMGFIDVLMVSRLGTDALAAISPAAFFVWIFIWAGMGTATSVQTFASQADGRGEPERGAEYAWQTVYLGAASFLAAWGVSSAMPMMHAWIGYFGQQAPAVLQAQVDYTVITVWSMVPAIMAGGLEGFFNGVKRPTVTLVASIVSLLTNVLFNWLFIFGPTIGMPAMTVPVLGSIPAWSISFPAWGIWGAGLATVIGWWARFAVMLAVFLSPEFDRVYHTRRAWRLRMGELGDVLRIGVPTALMGVAEISSWVVFLNLIAPHYGTPALAATNIALQYTHIAFMPAVGIGLALCSQVGFAIGARRLDEAVFRTRVALRLNMIYMFLAGVFLFVARYPLLRVMSVDQAVLEIGAWIMLWVSLYQVFDAMSITYIFSLRGAGDTTMPAILSGACCWIIFVGGSFTVAALAPQLGIHGAWIMAVAYLTALGLLLWWRFRSGVWQKIEVFGAARSAEAECVAMPSAAEPAEPADARAAPAGVLER